MIIPRYNLKIQSINERYAQGKNGWTIKISENFPGLIVEMKATLKW